jgi:TolB-like protein/class 3 adenylate cyclase
MSQTRRLAAILAADVAGYSRLIGADESGTLNRLRTVRTKIADPAIARHRGRIVKTTGDGLLIEFASVVDALQCATEIQAAMAERNTGIDTEKRIEFRMGINVGDIAVENGDIFGDGVNVAARLEGQADPGGICVSARIQEDAAGKLDLTFEDMGEQSLKNITRPVRVYRVRLDGVKGQSIVTPVNASPLLPLPDKPSIAVLPFTNMSGDSEQEYFADGMVEEIITALSRVRWLFVIARNSTFTYKGQAVDVKQVGRELGVRYVLEGSVRKAGQRVRITGQLIDALTGTHLWADRFDGSLEDVFELQDKVAVSVAGAIEPALEAAEIRRSTAQPTRDLTAYDLYLRALPHWTSLQKERLFLGLDLLGQAIGRDPHYGPALALAAHTRQFLAANDWVNDLEANRREGLDLARRALQSAPDNPDVLALAGFALGHFGEDINVALGLIDRALIINPSFARGWFLSGVGRLLAGQADLSIEHFQTSVRLNPRDRGRINSGIGMGGAHLFSRRFEEATTILLSSLQQAPDVPIGYRFLAASYAHMGRLDEAREIVSRLRAITPVVIPSVIPYRNPEHRELFLSGLRLAAGDPE